MRRAVTKCKKTDFFRFEMLLVNEVRKQFFIQNSDSEAVSVLPA